ncbi:hypothetical protein [Microbulbifer halophilus]|uniref:Uncharacterized protein n=1 Tax=Microbulbifer halophilus TaxID=453963 RepID=A0ABW5EHB8_9GAMM|nr:hypothetical protein [Microbulbifer halophilus]MCW8128010.1 hypothetical protein [Microbulbifer halophilus]
MTHENSSIIRPLSEREKELLFWLSTHPTSDVHIPGNEIDDLSIAAECGCGCASVDFAIGGEPISQENGITIVADYLYKSSEQNQMGCFLFLSNGHLGGIEVWSVDGAETPKNLPAPQELYSYEQAQR